MPKAPESVPDPAATAAGIFPASTRKRPDGFPGGVTESRLSRLRSFRRSALAAVFEAFPTPARTGSVRLRSTAGRREDHGRRVLMEQLAEQIVERGSLRPKHFRRPEKVLGEDREELVLVRVG